MTGMARSPEAFASGVARTRQPGRGRPRTGVRPGARLWYHRRLGSYPGAIAERVMRRRSGGPDTVSTPPLRRRTLRPGPSVAPTMHLCQAPVAGKGSRCGSVRTGWLCRGVLLSVLSGAGSCMRPPGPIPRGTARRGIAGASRLRSVSRRPRAPGSSRPRRQARRSRRRKTPASGSRR